MSHDLHYTLPMTYGNFISYKEPEKHFMEELLTYANIFYGKMLLLSSRWTAVVAQ